MAGEVVLDIETQNSFDEVGGYFTERLKVSVVGVYFYDTDTYETFLEPELPGLFSRLERSSRIIGFNSIGFDMPVLNNYYLGDLLKIPQLDMLAHINQALGFRLKLDSVAQSTLGTSKSGHGLQAVQWWKEGNIEAIKKYCLDDVKVTKEVYEFGLKNGFLLYDDRSGERHAIPIDFRQPKVPSTVNLSLGL